VVCPVGRHSHDHYRRLGVPSSRMVHANYCVSTLPFQLDDTSEARRRVRQDLGIAATASVFLYSGKLSERKGIDDLLAAHAQMSADVHLILMGDGERREEVLRQALPTIHWVGFKNQTEMSPYFHASDALVLPSRYSETWGLVVNEALHHGKPVVASSAVGSVVDLVVPGVTGEVSSPGDAASLTRALLRCASWMRSESVRDSCRAQVAGYSVERAAEGLRESYSRTV
jgi:glycosyltransferase involved in cell wall biosynthesis